jgi:hypothetical protein
MISPVFNPSSGAGLDLHPVTKIMVARKIVRASWLVVIDLRIGSKLATYIG